MFLSLKVKINNSIPFFIKVHACIPRAMGNLKALQPVLCCAWNELISTFFAFFYLFFVSFFGIIDFHFIFFIIMTYFLNVVLRGRQ